MTAWEATSFWQWMCSVSVGDIINLLFAVGTISMAVLTFILLRRQTMILEIEANDKDTKFIRKVELALVKLRLTMLFGEGKLAEAEMKFVEDERHNISRLFCDESNKAITDLLHVYYDYSDHMHGPEMFPDELNRILQEFRERTRELPSIYADRISTDPF